MKREKKYLYNGPEFPAEIPIDREIVLTAEKDSLAWPHIWGRPVGEYTKKYGLRSYIVKDHEAGNTALLDKLIAAGCIKEHCREVLREEKDNPAKCEKLFLTTYCLPYKAEDALFDAPAVNEGVSDACNVKTEAVIEVAMSMDEGDWKRYFYFDLKTAGPFCVDIVDFIQNDLEDSFRELIHEEGSGISYVDEEGSYAVQFFNSIGDMGELYFRTLSELFHNITGIRFVKLENCIVPRDEVK